MRYYILILLFTCTYTSYAQIGIGTTNPEKEIHVSGSNSTIRIESLNATNSQYNDGIKLARAFVDGNGNITIDNSGNGILPLNFLVDVPNFITDNPYNHSDPYDMTGVVVNSNTIQTENIGTLTTINLSVPRDALLEVKYGVTIYVRGSDMTGTPPWSETVPGESIQIGIYFCIDLNGDGLSQTEMDDKYGLKGLYYGSYSGGIGGHPYVNGQGYMEIPEGNHIMYFYGLVKDHLSTYTSVGFGGAEDFIKIRIFE
jgi:hypothetical protein